MKNKRLDEIDSKILTLASAVSDLNKMHRETHEKVLATEARNSRKEDEKYVAELQGEVDRAERNKSIRKILLGILGTVLFPITFLILITLISGNIIEDFTKGKS